MKVIKIVLAIFITFTLQSAVDSEAGYYHFDSVTAEKLMLSAINRIRLENGLSILKRNPKLERAARLHAFDMINRNYFDHTNPDGEGPRERALSLGIPYPVSENLGVLSSYGLNLENVVNELFKSLMDSPKHRANILNPTITDIGIAFVQDKENKTDFIKIERIGTSRLGFGTVVVCQEFMRKGLISYYPEPFPKEIKKGESIFFNGQTYKDFDTILFELIEKGKGTRVNSRELVMFERSFEEKLQFTRHGDFNLRIIGNVYDKDNNFMSEELVTFPLRVH